MGDMHRLDSRKADDRTWLALHRCAGVLLFRGYSTPRNGHKPLSYAPLFSTHDKDVIRMSSIKSAAMLTAALIVSGCSTATWVKLPDDSTLIVNERQTLHRQGLVKTRPFSWGAAGGVPYRLEDRQSHVIQSGRLKTRFRVASIFWPPVGIAYWPMGFGQRCYDLTGQEPQTCTYQDLVDLRRNHRLSR